jgi:GTP-binding protein HflX
MHRDYRARQRIPVVSLVGYTNAGKSSIMNALTSSRVLVEDKLFATLEPTTRKLGLPGGQEALLTDTVGFIQKLPAKLVAAFKATLEELDDATLLLVVVDVSDPDHAKQYQTVIEALADLRLHDKPAVVVLNKIDRLTALPAALLDEYPESVAISAAHGIGLDALLDSVATKLNEESIHVSVRIPFDRAELVALFRQSGHVESELHGTAGTTLRGHLPRYLWPRFASFAMAGSTT